MINVKMLNLKETKASYKETFFLQTNFVQNTLVKIKKLSKFG